MNIQGKCVKPPHGSNHRPPLLRLSSRSLTKKNRQGGIASAEQSQESAVEVRIAHSFILPSLVARTPAARQNRRRDRVVGELNGLPVRVAKISEREGEPVLRDQGHLLRLLITPHRGGQRGRPRLSLRRGENPHPVTSTSLPAGTSLPKGSVLAEINVIFGILLRAGSMAQYQVARISLAHFFMSLELRRRQNAVEDL